MLTKFDKRNTNYNNKKSRQRITTKKTYIKVKKENKKYIKKLFIISYNCNCNKKLSKISIYICKKDYMQFD